MDNTPHKWTSQHARPTSMGQYVTGLVKLAGGHLAKPAKMPRTPRKDKGTRRSRPNKREEDALRPLVRDELRRLGWKVVRVEPCVSGEFNLGDFWISHPYKKKAGWCEVKIPSGKLSIGQEEFGMECYLCKVRYWVIRSVEECRGIG